MVITRRRPKGIRARITSQGQITVPKAVRDQLGVRPGDELEFERRRDGFMVRPRPRVGVLDFAGIAQASAGSIPSTAEEIDALIAKGRAGLAVARDERLRTAAHRPGRGPA